MSTITRLLAAAGGIGLHARCRRRIESVTAGRLNRNAKALSDIVQPYACVCMNVEQLCIVVK